MLSVIAPQQLAAGGVQDKERLRLTPQIAHVGPHVGVSDAVLRVSERSIQQLAVTSDEAPLAGLAVAAFGRPKFAEFLSRRRIEPVAASLVVYIDAGGGDA